ncbi:MAG: hypothetical protein Q7V53_03350 [Caldisericota bacterium]|nr:hypothetical protein [Caldisericota bacterium]
MGHEHSAIEQLLSEVYWDKAKQYRHGGRGLENVLTAEVFQALDFLPRAAFLAPALRRAKGAPAAVEMLASQAEDAKISILSGDIFLEPLNTRGQSKVYAQPDAVIESPGVFCWVEAKRFGRSSFQIEQLAKEFALTAQCAGKRASLLLLVLPEEPPISVRSHGRMTIEDAISRGAEAIRQRFDVGLRNLDAAAIADVVAFVTWDEIEVALSRALDETVVDEPSISACLSRIAYGAMSAIRWHASNDE